MYKYFKIYSPTNGKTTLFCTNDPTAVIILKSDLAMKNKRVREITQAEYEELEGKFKEEAIGQ